LNHTNSGEATNACYCHCHWNPCKQQGGETTEGHSFLNPATCHKTTSAMASIPVPEAGVNKVGTKEGEESRTQDLMNSW
jgi:hypothetical protein